MLQKNILVTGGAGFLGTHLCESLLREANVICVDNFISSGQNNINHLLKLPNFEFVKHDMSEPLKLEEVPDLAKFQIPVFGISEIYNLACPMSVKHFDKHLVEIVRANSLAVVNALEIARNYKSKFMQFSSSVVYGQTPADEFIPETYRGVNDMLDSLAPYDEGKRNAETIVETYRRAYNLDTKIVRIFRTFGPYMLLDDGQMVPDFILNALENKDLIIYGDDNFRTSFAYVNDVIEGCLKVMRSDVNEPLNMGSTDVYRVVDIAEKIIELVGASKSKIKFEPPKAFMRQLALPDISKIKDEIGWFPIVTIEDGLRKTIDFTRAHKDLLTFSTDI